MKRMLLLLATMPLLFAACKNNGEGYSNSTGMVAAATRLAMEQEQLNAAAAEQKVVYVNSSSNQAKTYKKKGMSKAAKGAIIGGTAGAVTVGLITKSGKGAVVGGLIGAGTGYIIGRKKDKRDGRVQ